MRRDSLVLIVAGVVTGYLAKDPSFNAVVGIAAVGVVALALLHWWRNPAVTTTSHSDDLDHLGYELTRARRFGRELGLVVVQPVVGTMPESSRRTVVHAVGTRRIDRTWMDGDTLFILLPETDQHGTEIVIRRIEADLAPGSVRTASAVFPVDALTSGGLINTALSGLDSAAPIRSMRAADTVS